jgi:hypothetical protein
MKYIFVDPHDLTVQMRDDRRKKGVTIPVSAHRDIVLRHSFYGLVYFSVIYGMRRKEDRRKGIKNVDYCLPYPDPWLVAVAAIMWEGLLQGLTWDAIKLAVCNGLSVLRRNRLAPTTSGSIEQVVKKHDKRKARTEMGFSWRAFSKDGKPLRELFLGVRGEYEHTSQEQRESFRDSK